MTKRNLLPLLLSTLALVLLVHPERAAAQVQTGAYQKISTRDSKVIRYARFAVSRINRAGGDGDVRFVKVLSAERQVVAGMNYRMTIQVKQNRKARKAVAIVFEELDSSYSMSDWTWKR